MAKPRSDSKLLNLSEAEQARIVAWMLEGVGDEGDTSYKAVREQIHLDFGFTVAPATLTEFWRKVAGPAKVRRSAEAAGAFKAAVKGLGGEFEEAVLGKIQQLAFEILADDNPDPQLCTMFLSAFGDIQKTRLRKEDLELKRDRFKASIAKKIDLGLEELHAEIKGNAEALALYERLVAVVRKEVGEA